MPLRELTPSRDKAIQNFLPKLDYARAKQQLADGSDNL